MLHLLTETHLFVSLPNDCLCQMTGEPVIYMAPVALRGLERTSAAPLARRSVQVNKRPFPFPEACQDERQGKRLKMDISTPTHYRRTNAAVSKYVARKLVSRSSSLSYGQLDILPWISCFFVPGYSMLDQDRYPTRIILLLDCQINVGLHPWPISTALTAPVRCTQSASPVLLPETQDWSVQLYRSGSQ